MFSKEWKFSQNHRFKLSKGGTFQKENCFIWPITEKKNLYFLDKTTRTFISKEIIPWICFVIEDWFYSVYWFLQISPNVGKQKPADASCFSTPTNLCWSCHNRCAWWRLSPPSGSPRMLGMWSPHRGAPCPSYKRSLWTNHSEHHTHHSGWSRNIHLFTKIRVSCSL